MKKLIIRGMVLLTLIFSLAGCGKKDQSGDGTYKDVKTSEIEAVVAKSLGDNYYPSMEIDANYLNQNLHVSEDMYTEFTGKIPMISVNVDTFIVVKAKEGKAADVEKAFNNAKNASSEDTMQYPMNIAKIQNSKVVKYGNYVMYIQLGGTAVESKDEAAAKKAVEADNKKAEDAVLSVIK